ASVTVVINPLPNVALNPFGTVCLNAAPFTLSNGIPADGNYTGNGITSNVFNPSVMGVGSSIVTYTYTDINGCSGEAQGIITVSDCLGLDEESVQFALFPNPTAGKFTITSNIVPIDQVVIYDAQGKMVYNENYAGIMHAEFDMNAYSNGVYYIEIRNNNELQSRMPLVINH
ncbi:MAG TPA: T9SS type A sorting domain-containing protein, partial [Fluviicola sp.]|nr:T9SS type A sorting domain-containing protein [Fluviicola sp.]